MPDPTLTQHAPSLVDLATYYINQYSPALAAPIMYGIKKGYDSIVKIQDLMEKQNELLTKLLKEQTKP